VRGGSVLALTVATIFLNVVLVLIVLLRPVLLEHIGGKVLAFFGFFLLPCTAFLGANLTHLETSQSTEFCLSCHVMEPYGKSLYIDRPDAIAAAHFQNARIPREKACYTCHTTYTMFGDIHTKIRGLKHLYYNYFSDPEREIALYDPFENRECLHCHNGARSFEEHPVHVPLRAQIGTGELKCVGCHNLFIPRISTTTPCGTARNEC
jgi:nitrate/TMAO reductase-like tetraheme cytochrome c subunit